MNQKKYDLIVAGGGFAGVSAALSAAREGLCVLLFDKNNCLGGAAASCLVTPFMCYWTENPTDKKRMTLSAGLFTEITDKMTKMGAMTHDVYFNEEYLKIVLNRMLLEAGVTLLFNSYLIDATMKNGKVVGVTVANKSGQCFYEADYFIDATGDGDLSVLCDFPYHIGREADHLCQPMTLCFRVANVDMDKFSEQEAEIQALYQAYREQGKIKNIREDVLTFPVPIDGVLHFNSTRIVKKSPVNAEEITVAEIEAREQCFELFNFLKENFDAFKNSEMLMTAQTIGVRESRMIEGEYVLTQEDLIACTKFDDSIAVGNYDIDIHNPEGSGTSHYYFKDGEYYTIPYRCLIPKNSINLLVAGRCISSTHEAQASYRIMPICCCIGQAAGTAIALCKKDGTDVRHVDVLGLQTRLKACGAVID